MKVLLTVIVFVMSVYNTSAQDKVTIFCKMYIYDTSPSQSGLQLQIDFGPYRNAPAFKDKGSIQKLKEIQSSLTHNSIKNFMNSLNWSLIKLVDVSQNSKIFYFKKVFDQSEVDFIPTMQFRFLGT